MISGHFSGSFGNFPRVIVADGKMRRGASIILSSRNICQPRCWRVQICELTRDPFDPGPGGETIRWNLQGRRQLIVFEEGPLHANERSM
jgi:hypothetical protein